jgi:hypothetical protein
MRQVADIGLGIVGQHAALFGGTNLGLDRLGFDGRRQRQFECADRFALDLRHVGFGRQPIAREAEGSISSLAT